MTMIDGPCYICTRVENGSEMAPDIGPSDFLLMSHIQFSPFLPVGLII